MRPNFNSRLNLRNNSRTVRAGGPCNWDPGDVRAVIRDVTITQGSVVGSSSGSTEVRNGRDTEWWLEATSPSQFTPGPAQPHAVALVYTTGGGSYERPWPDLSSEPTPTVQLN
jgi:hypothetical protein